MHNYKKIFESFENGLLDYGSRNLSIEAIQASLDKFKAYEVRALENDDYFEILVFVAFYSGFKASTVTSRRDVIKEHFPCLEAVAKYGSADIERVFSDQRMIKNKRKIESCVNNAKQMKKLVVLHGSFHNYIESFNALNSFENLVLLKEELEAKFDYLGGITVYHFLTDIGMPVLKPDRVICRIFERLGFIENDKQLLKTVIHGRKMAAETKHPIRYIDIVLVAYGQVESKEFGIDRGICLKEPRCAICNVKDSCNYYHKIVSKHANCI